jgi:hypothetical protein
MVLEMGAHLDTVITLGMDMGMARGWKTGVGVEAGMGVVMSMGMVLELVLRVLKTETEEENV